VNIEELFNTRRWCYFIPRGGFVEGKGFRVSVIFENERGHFPTGGDGKEPWFWGMTYEEAEEVAAQQNDAKLGLSTTDVWEIVASTLTAERGRDPSHHKTMTPRAGKR
jgi:hypothetical protein